jgi:nicotinate-nucleotide--dimethylbenzimidazole phosphoribosyltransferase
MPEPVASLDEIRALMGHLPGPDLDAGAAAALREKQLTKPAGALGRLEELAAWLAVWQGRHPPTLDHPRTIVFAANHGVNLDTPTGDIVDGPAMSEEECARAIAYGMMAVEPGIDALAVGEMGIANTTIAAALCLALFAGDAAEWTGPGTGVVGAALEKKREVVVAAVARHQPEAGDPFDVLRRLGGLEFAAMTGAILAARMGRVPVVLDGFCAGAAAAVLYAADPRALDHCVAGHVSAEPGHRRLLDRLGKPPLLDLGMRLGEASGATLALGILKAAAACHAGMASFAEAGVSGPAG